MLHLVWLVSMPDQSHSRANNYLIVYVRSEIMQHKILALVVCPPQSFYILQANAIVIFESFLMHTNSYSKYHVPNYACINCPRLL